MRPLHANPLARLWTLWIGLYVLAVSPQALAERKVTVITTINQTEYDIGEALQFAVGELFKETGQYEVTVAEYEMPGFSPQDTAEAHQLAGTELIALAMMEEERISVIVFDQTQPTSYAAAVQDFSDAPAEGVSSEYLEIKLRSSFNQVHSNLQTRSYEPLPGTEPAPAAQVAQGATPPPAQTAPPTPVPQTQPAPQTAIQTQPGQSPQVAVTPGTPGVPGVPAPTTAPTVPAPGTPVPTQPSTDSLAQTQTPGQLPQAPQVQTQAQPQVPTPAQTLAPPGHVVAQPQPGTIPQTGAPVAPPVATVPPVRTPATRPRLRTLGVMNTVNQSEFDLGAALQYAVAELYRETGQFDVELSGYTMHGFSPTDTAKAHKEVRKELLSFTLMESNRLAIFLFDQKRPQQFAVAYEDFKDKPQVGISATYLEGKIRAAFEKIIFSYSQGKFNDLPGVKKKQKTALSKRDLKELKEQSKRAAKLFTELTSVRNRKYYTGATVGMVRFQSERTVNKTASTVNFGLFGGFRIMQRLELELNLDIFTYALAGLNVRYQLPLAEQFAFLSATFGIGTTLFVVSEAQGFGNVNLPIGEMYFGPGINLEIPVMNASIRGGVRLLLGSGNILIGNYGISYALKI